MKRLFLIALIVLSLAFSACGSISLPAGGMNDLLRAPTLNQKQADLDEALSATLSLTDIVYRYPRKGENKTPFIFYDLDGDSVDEALVFYSFTTRMLEIRAKVLRQDTAGKWYSFCDVPGQGDQIDFVEFTSLVSSELPSVVFGWQDTSRNENTMEIYTMSNDRFERDISQKYSAYSVTDYGGNELSRVIIITREITQENRNPPFELKMLAGQAGHVSEISSLTLNPEVTAILQMKQGRLWDGTIGIYIDEVIDNGAAVATEITRVNTNSLEVVAGFIDGVEDLPEDGDYPERERYISTFRPDRTLCADINDDDQVEVTHAINMPGVEETDETPSLALTVYRRLTSEGFVIACTAAVNYTDGYLIFYPERWLENVGVVSYPEAMQWRFFKIDEKSMLPSAELLRITVHSQHDFDGRDTDGYLLGTKGATRYYGHIPQSSDEPLAITQKELDDMFKLI